MKTNSRYSPVTASASRVARVVVTVLLLLIAACAAPAGHPSQPESHARRGICDAAERPAAEPEPEEAKEEGSRSLSVRADKLGDKDFQRVAAMRSLRSLEILTHRVEKPGGNEDGLKYLAASTSLRRLAVGGGWLTDRGMEHIAAIPNLEELMIGGCKQSNHALTEKALAVVSTMQNLRVLRIYRFENAADISFAALTHCQALESLTLVEMGWPGRTTDATWKHLAAIPNLQTLELSHFAAGTRDDLLLLAGAKGLKQLRLWAVAGWDADEESWFADPITDAQIDALRKLRPDLKVSTAPEGWE